jgi:hypothetical protein
MLNVVPASVAMRRKKTGRRRWRTKDAATTTAIV